ncbi:kinesin-like protein [Phytophthora cinnamomi]|uniref:kinesin-like protein n=1 Tax=Phytophthora cinnamomi TaxID=4785 RepID=UPI00355A0257|nr:kinesin-like protein [Phytophthora cinnamomi]
MQRRSLKPPPAPASLRQASDSDEDTDDHHSSCSAGEARVRPLAEPPARPRKDGSVQVAVRIRPMLPRELARSAATCVEKPRDEDNAIRLVPTATDLVERKFTFDHVFPQSTKQTELYDDALRPWMASFLQGFNVTVIAYGQTGSGKTHTMGNSMPSTSMMANSLFARSPSSDDSSDEEAADTLDSDEGLIPRFLYHLFTKLNESGSNCQLSVSFLEIYGEDIHDLLESSDAQRANRHSEPLQLRENKKNGVWVQGLTEVRVSNRHEAMEQMRRGSLQRITASTQMNERSSRSHAVYTVKMIQRVSEQDSKKGPPVPNNQEAPDGRKQTEAMFGSTNGGEGESEASGADAVIVSKLTFVDLAGSERLKKTLAEGERMKEGIQINVGLFALGNVINALGDEKRRAASHVHVPYRSSKLTRLLQDALGGNSRTLFIACVSPADINANETLNTLQYANRAKNIQNKAVKNIDSRSAELASLKAFNHLLCRELVKAIFTGLDEGVPEDVDRLTDSCMGHPKVMAYLGKIEQLTSSGGLESSNDERLFETRRLLDGLTAHLHGLVPNNGHRRAISLTSMNDEAKTIEPPDDYLDFMSDSGSSVAIMEEQKPNADAAFVTPYPLGKLCRTLEAMNLAFEMKEIQQMEKRQRESHNAKATKMETRYHRHELLRNGLSDMIERMRTWLSSPLSDQQPEKRRSIERNIEEAVEKLELMEIEMEEMQRKKTALAQEIEVQLMRCRKELKTKQEEMEQLRQTPEDATTNALNVLTRRTEIKVRFDEYDLDSILSYLKDEEKEMASFIDEDDAAISFMSPLFTKEELSSAYSRDVLSLIQDQLRIAFDKEALEASMNKEVRKRAQLFQNITNGLMACHNEDMTEQAFMEKNEQNLKDCEDSISQIRDAMRAKRGQRASMATILDSITTLDAAKDVIRRLIVEIYSHWRIYMVFDEEEDMRQQREAEEALGHNLAAAKSEMDKQVETLERKYVKDVQCAFEMVTGFNNTVGSDDITQVREPLESSMTTKRLVALVERERLLLSQLAAREDEMAAMRAELDRFQASAKSMEMKEESFRLMNKCQEIWKELGLNEEDQASKFQDINELLLKKCSEELKGLEGAREKLQNRIDHTYRFVSRMESILHVPDPVDIGSLPAVAGVTLLEQEAHMLALQKGLVNEVLRRISTHVRVVEGIQELAAGLEIRSAEDFRHISRDEVGSIDDVLIRASYADLDVCRRFQRNPDSVSLLEQLLNTLSEKGTAAIANPSIQQEEFLFNALLKEKTKRITELEESLKVIRSVAHMTHLSQDDIVSIIHTLRDVDSSLQDGNEETGIFDELCAWILQTGGQLDVSKRGLEALAKLLQGFEEVHAGRKNALEFLNRTLEEGAILAHDINGEALADAAQDELQCSTSPRQNTRDLTLQDSECFVDTLAAGKKMMEELSGPVERSLRSMFYSMNDEFAAFGIDTEEQRVSFFLGRKDEGHEARRSIIEKYAVFSSRPSSCDDEEEEVAPASEIPLCTNDSFLSKLDPTFNEFHWFYSVSFGRLRLQSLRELVAGMTEVKSVVQSAQNRLRSLQKIMKIFNKINEFKTKIAEFEASASQKDRLFGNSLRLLEEERFRKMAAKHYPNLLASLRKEVSRWLENEDGEYDLSVLGEELKKLLLDMMNTDTGLMHLDLGTVRRPSKQAVTPNSSSSNLQAASSGSGQRAATPARARTLSQSARAHTPRARSLNFDM